MDEAHALAQPTGEVQLIGPVAAARAEAAWLAGRDAATPQQTEAAFELALRSRARWMIGELAFWRWRAGVYGAAADGGRRPVRAFD